MNRVCEKHKHSFTDVGEVVSDSALDYQRL